MNTTQHDELARLFAQNMHLAQAAAQPDSSFGHVPHDMEKQADQPIHFISSHYTQTAHIRPDTTSDPSGSPPPPYAESSIPAALADTLRQHSIDPSALLPTQAQLFLNANYEQRLRLLELWRISPPSYPLEEHLNGSNARQTSLEQEEMEARTRYEYKVQQGRYPREEHMIDTTIVEPISPIRDPGEPAWPPAARMRAASIAAAFQPGSRCTEAEPYIGNGYHAPRTAPSVDPVYAAAAGQWQAPRYAHAVQEHSTMENQYGMYEQIRCHADWERMNEQVARQKFDGLQGQVDDGMDEDMVM